MKNFTRFLLLVLCCCACFHSQAKNDPSNGDPTVNNASFVAPPVNNECATATLLTPGATCTPTAGTNVEATQSIAPITCGIFTSSSALDVWYQFTATVTSHTVTVVGGAGFDAIIDVRSGACNGANIGCADATVSGGTEATTLAGLTVGNTYLVRVYGWAGGTGTFTICVTGAPAAPANNECANATTLTSGTTCTPTAGTNVNATQSIAPITCGIFTSSSAQDVWYKFTAVVATHSVTVVGGAGFDAIIDVRSGACNGANLGCADGTTGGGTESTVLAGLTVGNTYLVRVYGWAGGTGTFTICVTHAAPPAPANNDCANAVTLTPGATCTPTTGTTVNATQSLAAITCATFTGTADDDVWYKFTATAANHNVTVVGGAGFDAVVDVRSGSCNGANIGCADATFSAGTETVTLSGLTVGATYLVRVYSFSSLVSGQGTFTICVTTPAQVPACVSAPTSPTNGQTGICPGSVTLSWPSSAGATSYDVYFGTTAVPPFVANVLGTTYNAGTLAAGTYFWQIRPRNAAGPAAGCTVWTFTVGDATAPSITCPANVTTTNSPASACGAVVTYGSTSATDACSPPVITLIGGLASGSTFPGGVTTVVFRATDASGNSSTCSFTVTVNDVSAPSITCPANVMANNNPATACSAVVTHGAISATDNCGAPTITLVSGLASGSTFAVGTTTNVYRATDAAGNSVTCSFTVTVKDVTPPVAKCKNATVNLPANGSLTLQPSVVNNVSTDNCSVGLSVTPNPLTCANLGATIVTLRATDPAGNSSTCTATVTVKDVMAPSALCKTITVFLDSDGDASITAGQLNNSSFDACGITSMTASLTQFDCFHINGSPVQVVLTLKDASNNQSNCTAQVYVKDNIAPTAFCLDKTVTLSSSGKVIVQTAPLATNSGDNCSITSYVPASKTYTTANIGVNNLTITVKDWSGNGGTCVSQITVLPFGSSLQAVPNVPGVFSEASENLISGTELILSLFPNPTSGESTVQFRLAEEQPYHLRLFDLNGRLILNQDLQGYAGDNSVVLEMGKLQAGIYLVEVQSEGMCGRTKVVVQR